MVCQSRAACRPLRRQRRSRRDARWCVHRSGLEHQLVADPSALFVFEDRCRARSVEDCPPAATPGSRDHQSVARDRAGHQSVRDVGELRDRAANGQRHDPPLFAALCSPNLEIALRRIGQFKPLIGPVRLRVSHEADALTLAVDFLECDIPPPGTLVAAELGFFVKLARLATRTELSARAVTLPRDVSPQPPRTASRKRLRSASGRCSGGSATKARTSKPCWRKSARSSRGIPSIARTCPTVRSRSCSVTRIRIRSSAHSTNGPG